MKPESRERAFNREGWLFELKYDGFRLLAAGGAGEARLYYKSGHDATAIFPEIVQGIAALPWRGLLLDGEVTVLDAAGRPNFQRLQRRGLRTRLADVRHAAAARPGHPLRLRPAGLWRVRPAASAARRAQAAAAPADPGRRPPDPPQRGGPRARRGPLRRGRRHGARGDRRQAGRLAVSRRLLGGLAEGARRPQLRLRRRRLRAGGAHRAAPAPPRGARHGSRGRRAGLRRDRRHRLRARGAEGDPRPARSPAPRISPGSPDAGGGRPDHRLDRAGAGGRGALQGMDRKRPSPPSRLPAPARRQDRRRVLPPGRGARGRRGRRTGGDREAGPGSDRLHQSRQGLLAGGGSPRGT